MNDGLKGKYRQTLIDTIADVYHAWRSEDGF